MSCYGLKVAVSTVRGLSLYLRAVTQQRQVMTRRPVALSARPRRRARFRLTFLPPIGIATTPR
jgi:hypothetical protein